MWSVNKLMWGYLILYIVEGLVVFIMVIMVIKAMQRARETTTGKLVLGEGGT
jgi:large-conductance mechanosensitive channel